MWRSALSTERDDRLRRIYQKARTLRRRRFAWVGGSAVAILLAAGTAVSTTQDRDERSNVATHGDGSTTSTSHSSTSTTAHDAPTSTSTSTGTSTSASTTSTSLVCRNSTNPACGPFRYDPPAPDLPPTVTLTASPSAATVGAVVTITVTVHEPDGPPGGGCYGELAVDSDTDHPRVIREPVCSVGDPDCWSPGCPARYGPWDPPSPGRLSFSVDTTFDTPGEHEVRYTISDHHVPWRPGEIITRNLVVTVTAQAPPSTT